MKPAVFAIAGAALLGWAFSSTPSSSSEGAGSCLGDEPSYIGVSGCKACHFGQWRSWKGTPMAKTFENLKPGQAAEAKTKHGLDPQKDYTKDPSCLACHTTGYGKPGGYPALVEGKEWSEEEAKRAKDLEGVQCEACHGPGSLYGPHKKDHEDYAKADILKMGMIEPVKAHCETCHNKNNPTAGEDYKFDYETAIKDEEKLHKHTPLKKQH